MADPKRPQRVARFSRDGRILPSVRCELCYYSIASTLADRERKKVDGARKSKQPLRT